LRSTEYLGLELAEILHAIGRSHHASLPQVIAAATALYLHRITNAENFALGVPVTAVLEEKCGPRPEWFRMYFR